MIWIWIAFIAFVLLVLALDLGVFHRKAHVVGVKEALAWSAVWLAMGLAFAVFVYFAYDGQWFGLGAVVDAVDGLVNDGASATEKYLTGYVVEKSLSVDNVFVIAMIIFGFFAVPPIYQHRVLFWGILGALLLRGDQDALPQDGSHRSEQEHRRSVDAPLVPGDRQIPRRALCRSRRCTRVVRERGPRCARGPG